MKNKHFYLAYVPVAVVGIFLLAVLAIHLSGLPRAMQTFAADFIQPYRMDDRRLTAVDQEAMDAGLAPGDKIVAIEGVPIDDSGQFLGAAKRFQAGDTVNVTIERQGGDGAAQTFEAAVPAHRHVKNINHYLRIAVATIFLYCLPCFSILLGLWVVLMRPRDLMAWVLLVLLCGFGAIAMEGYSDNRIILLFKSIFGSAWTLAMLLFGIYFPERWKFDIRFPWVKWILIVPLAYQIFIAAAAQLRAVSGIDLPTVLQPFNSFFFKLVLPLNIIAVFFFFVALGWKSGTMENRDARRRLKLMVFGASFAMLPTFFLLLYIIAFRKSGSFFDIAPSWYALLALFNMALFPLTMAYVIVVHRAMDVSVVIRQGIQYALAKNGVLVLRVFLSAVVILAAFALAADTRSGPGLKILLIAAGAGLVFGIRFLADRLRIWTDRRFFRDAYNSEQILTELSENVSRMVETRPLLETLSAKLSESLHVPQIAMLLKQNDMFVPAYSIGYDIEPAVQIPEDAKDAGILRANEPLLIDEASVEDGDVLPPAGRAAAASLNSHLLLPVGSKNGVAGIISLGPKLSEEPYSPNDLRLLRSVASQAGLALENASLTEAIAKEAAQKERLNRELEIAREVQERLFPQELPSIEGIDYYGACRPALGVGGDYYDFLELSQGRLGLAIGDVSGKGIGAALMMASLQASLRGQTLHSGDDLATLMYQINRLVYEASTTNRYATFFYGQYDPAAKKLIYVNAGHNPPVLLRPVGEDIRIIKLETGGPVVGMLPPMLVNYSQGEIDLLPGDMLVGSTDGITEAMNCDDEEWGEDAMIESLKRLMDAEPKEVLERIVADADAFAAGAPQHDDMTLIVLKFAV